MGTTRANLAVSGCERRSVTSALQIVNHDELNLHTKPIRHTLLNPKDGQDVSRAIRLLCLVADLRRLDVSDFTPSEKITHRALSLLGEMFDALVNPFIMPTLSLSEQMIQLLKFAHMACALFMKHDGDFSRTNSTGIFSVLNPMLKVFLSLLGDDVLEILFGRSRMIGGHSPNHDVDELRRRICSALRVDKIFEKYPHLERRARRLRLVRNRDVDHLSPREWEGDLTAGSCDIHACYHAGVAQARAVLAKYGCDTDFTACFSQEGFDLMRPKGGKYPGLFKEVDRLLENASAALDSETTAPESTSSAGTNLDAQILTFDANAALAAEQVVRAAQEAAAPLGGHSLWISLNEDGSKKAHKKQFYEHSWIPHSTSRMERAIIGFFVWDRTASTAYSKSTANDHLLKIHGLFATLICFDTSKVSLAILQCTGIKITSTHPITYLEAAPSAEISLPDSKYEVSGQILSLVPFDESTDPSIVNISWAWVTEYVSFESTKAKKASGGDTSARMRHLSVTSDGRLVLPLTSTDSKQSTLEEILKIPPTSDKDSEKTWVFSNAQLEVLGASLCDRVKEEEVRLKIPTFGMVKEGRYPSVRGYNHK
ncbi:hypothetical protein R3P38DRAFT_3196381 [Favolaschia claudopus]|uniref:Uncharacterized protein n=1 Tax=Favolaschia claudopus TaxID=2862362 RepID=A0AAW0B9Z2_9AGAR